MTFKKHGVAALAATAAIAMSLSGCGAGGNDGEAEAKLSEGDVTITLNWWGSDGRVKLTEAAVDRFEKANPNIHVQTIYSDWGGYWDKLSTSIAGGDAPDVMQMDESYFSSYASQGAFYDMSKVSDYLDLSNLNEANKKAGQIDGTQYAAEVSVTLIGVIANMDILDELGIELPDTSKWTWEEFEDLCKQVVEKSGGKYTGTQPTFGGYDYQLWQRQHGKRTMFEGNKVSVDKELLKEYMQKAYDWTHGSNPIAGSTDKWSEQFSAVNSNIQDTDMAKGTQAFSFGSGALTSQLAQYSKALNTENVKLLPMPVTEGGTSDYYYMKVGMYWAISSKTEHPAEAAKLIDFLINDEETGKEFGTDRGIPANNKIRAELSSNASALDKQLYDYVDQMAEISGDTPDPTPAGGGGSANLLLRKLQDVVFERSTVDKAADEFIAELQSEIDQAQ